MLYGGTLTLIHLSHMMLYLTVNDKLVILAYTHKQLTNISGVGEYPLTMANIDELLMAIQSCKNIYVPKFS